MPAVSTRISSRPLNVIGRSMASRVVPATGETITRSEPAKRLSSEDLPTLGRPIRARRMASSASSDSASLRRERRDPVEQVAGAQALRGGDGDRLAQPQRVELRGQREVLGGVDLVGGHQHRQRGAAQQLGHLLIAGAQAGPGVNDEHRRVGVGQRGAGLVLDLARQRVVVLQVDAAGVDQRQHAPVPLRAQLLAVTRDAGPLVHDGLARLGQAIDQ